jgi:hypothetical protein
VPSVSVASQASSGTRVFTLPPSSLSILTQLRVLQNAGLVSPQPKDPLHTSSPILNGSPSFPFSSPHISHAASPSARSGNSSGLSYPNLLMRFCRFLDLRPGLLLSIDRPLAWLRCQVEGFTDFLLQIDGRPPQHSMTVQVVADNRRDQMVVLELKLGILGHSTTGL